MSMPELSEKSVKKANNLCKAYLKKTGTSLHPNPDVSDGVLKGLAHMMDVTGKPLCPCRFYPDKQEEAQHRTWVCPCDDMQIYKYCHCLLFVKEDGNPITEYLPDGHEGIQAYGDQKDPTPDLGRPMRDKWEEREKERRERC